MSKKFLSGINVTGTATLNTVANAGLDTDKFLVLDAAGNVDFRTGDELKADIGADVVSRIEHEVKLGESMTIGTPVYVGVDLNAGTNMTVYKATNATEAGSSKTLGLIASSGITNDLVEVVTEGLLEGLNTSTATKGDPVWLGVDGALLFGLANKPVAPAHMVFLGIVTRVQSNNGEIFVKVQNGFEMNEIHNYLQGSVQNNEVIVYESATSLYKPKSIPTILGYTPVPDSRTITINGTTYDLSANRAWTITTDASARSILRYVATANQTTFTISGGYTPGLTDVYRNGVKLDNSTDFTATNGTTIVLTNGASVNDVIEVYRYQTAFLANNALRTVTEFIATAGQTTFSVTYNSGLVDVFYNGSKLLSTEYTAGNGTSIILNFPCNVNDTLEVHAYSYAVGAFTGQAQLNGTGFIKVSGTTVTYDNSTYLTSINSSQVTTALGYTPYNATNPSGYITSSALSSYLPLSGGTLTGALSGTSATFSGAVSGTTGSFNGSVRAVNLFNLYKSDNTTLGGQLAYDSSINQLYLWNNVSNGYFSIYVNFSEALKIISSGAATFLNTVSSRGYLANDSGTIGTPIDTGGTKAYFDASGINGAALTVRADSVGRTIRMTSDGGGTVVGAIDINSSGLNIGTNTSHPIIFKPQATEAMRITTGRAVGIRSTNPEQPLHVNQGITGFNQGIPGTSGTTQNGILRLTPAQNTFGECLDFGMNVATTYAWIQATNTGNLAVNYNIVLNPNGGNVAIGLISSSVYRLNVSGSLRSNRSVYNWHNSAWQGNSTYWHMKTNLWAGGSPNGNSQYTMSYFKGYSYSYNGSILEGSIGFHNWDGYLYSVKTIGTLFANAYVSSDGYVVLVVQSGYQETGITIDWHQHWDYTFREAVVTAAGLHGTTTGKY